MGLAAQERDIDAAAELETLREQLDVARGANHQLLERLAQSELHYLALAESLPLIFWTRTPDGELDYCNGRWTDYSGLSQAESQGRRWYRAVHPDDVGPTDRCWQRAVYAGQPFEIQHRLRRGRDGVYRWYLTQALPARDATGQVLRWFGTSTDIDDQKRSHERALEELRLRDEFLSIASHELKTPLTSLCIQAKLLAREAGPGMEPRAELIDRQLQRLGALVERLLDVTRISAGRIDLAPAELDLATLVRDVAGRFLEDAARNECRIEVHAPTPVPGRWDALRLEQVVQNLLSNAVKYAPRTTVQVRVSVEDAGAVVVVRDRGMGIAPEDQGRIFGKFERAVPAAQYGGLGLGLYIVRQLLDAMQGTIAVESVVGEGSTFTVKLPGLTVQPR